MNNMKTAYIRPTYVGERLVSLALCKTNNEIISDSNIIEHFDNTYSSNDIKIEARELGFKAVWGYDLQVNKYPLIRE